MSIDISGIDCPALRRLRQNPEGFSADRRTVVSATFLNPRLAGGRSQTRAGTMVRWILSAGRVGAEVSPRGDGEPPLLSSSERPGAMGYGSLRQREGSGSDSASPAWPGEGRWVVAAAIPRGSFRFLPGLGTTSSVSLPSSPLQFLQGSSSERPRVAPRALCGRAEEIGTGLRGFTVLPVQT